MCDVYYWGRWINKTRALGVARAISLIRPGTKCGGEMKSAGGKEGTAL
jgi:hypothetical protein